MGHHSSNVTLEDKKLRSEPHPIFGVEGMESSLPSLENSDSDLQIFYCDSFKILETFVSSL